MDASAHHYFPVGKETKVTPRFRLVRKINIYMCCIYAALEKIKKPLKMISLFDLNLYRHMFE